MKLSYAILLLLVSAPALAQQSATPPTMAELKAAHEVCDDPANFQHPTAVGPGMGAWAKIYTPEYKNICETLDAEIARLNTADQLKATRDAAAAVAARIKK